MIFRDRSGRPLAMAEEHASRATSDGGRLGTEPPGAPLRSDRLRIQGPVARYAFSIVGVLVALELRLLLIPLTGKGAPFVIFFAAALVTSLFAGVGPALLSLAVSLPTAVYLFVLPAGYTLSEALYQAALYGIDGLIIVYLTLLIARWRRRLEGANTQLRESEERFRLTIDEAPIGMALVALDGHFVRVNRVLSEITGYSPDELYRLTFQDITHRDDLEKDLDFARELAAGDIPRYHLEKRYIKKDRSIVDVMLSASILRGPDGVARYYIAQVEDITARKRAEAALRLSEAKFSGIVSIAADAIISVDEQQRITIFNDGAEQIFGYAEHEMLGTPLERLIPERFRAVHRTHFADFAVGPDTARTMGERQDIFGLRKNGEEFPAEASISRVSVGGTRLFSVVLRDITQRKQVEEALKRAVTARDEVLGVVAHDLRNPLGTILMQASMLEQLGAVPDGGDQAPQHVIARAAKRMNRLIRDLLDVAGIESGQLKVDRVRLSAHDLVRETIESHTPLATSCKLALSGDVASDVHDIWGDHDRLLQVFDNLVGNAIKFTPGGGRIVVAAVMDDGNVRFSVTDTGPGIAPDNLAHIFERFWQAATRERRLGAGLGLPITQGIVNALGGKIWATSTEGHGSTFFFTIPAAPPDRDRPLEPNEAGGGVRHRRGR